MSNNLKALYEEAVTYISPTEAMQLIVKDVKESFSRYNLYLPDDVTISLDEVSSGIAITSPTTALTAADTALAQKCAENVLQAIILKRRGVLQPTIKPNRSFKIFFYFINSLLLVGVLSWVISLLLSSDFRQWYQSELVATNAFLVNISFLLLYPLFVMGCTLYGFVRSRTTAGLHFGALLFKFEIPMLLAILGAQALIIELPMTDGLRLFFTFVSICLLVTVCIIAGRGSEPRSQFSSVLIFRQLLSSLSLTTVSYFILAVLIPFTALILSEIDVTEAVTDIMGEIQYNPLSVLYVLFGLGMYLVPFVVSYYLLKKLLVDFRHVQKLLSEQYHHWLSPLLCGAVVVSFVGIMFITTRGIHDESYTEALILLSEAEPTYQNLASRSVGLSGYKEEVQRLLDMQFRQGQYYLFDHDDFTSSSYPGYDYQNDDSYLKNLYARIVLFPFIAPADQSVHNTAFENGFLRAYGEPYNAGQRAERVDQIKQVQHLTRDIFVISNKSETTAEVTITDSFSTFVQFDQEVVFEFSLPEDAVVTNLLLGPALQYRGVIAPRGAAEQLYNEEVRQRIDPALLEQVGPRQYRLRVYPIPATSDFAEQTRREKVEAATQRVQFTYMVTKTPEGVPLPQYSRTINVLDSETTYVAQVNGVSVPVTKMDRVISGAEVMNDWCANNTTVTENWSEGRVATQVSGSSACQLISNALASHRGKKIAILVDTSHKNIAGGLAEALTELRQLPEEFYTANNVTITRFSQVADGGVRVMSPADIPEVTDLVYFGSSDLAAAVRALPADTEVFIVLRGAATDVTVAASRQVFGSIAPEQNVTGAVSTQQSLFSLSDTVLMIHEDSKIPAYAKSTQDMLKGAGSVVVSDSVRTALVQNGIRYQLSDAQLLFVGDYWYMTLATNVMATSSAEVRVPMSLGSVRIATRGLIKELLKEGVGYDAVQQIAMRANVVSPISSNIALVNERQLVRLEELKLQDNRYEQSQSYIVTQPRLSNPLSVSGFGSNSMGLSTGLEDESISSMVPSSLPNGAGVRVVEEKTSAGQAPIMIFFSCIIIALVTMIWYVRKQLGRKA